MYEVEIANLSAARKAARWDAMLSLMQSGEAVVPELVQRLESDDIQPDTHWRICAILSRIGPPASVAVDSLIKVLQRQQAVSTSQERPGSWKTPHLEWLGRWLERFEHSLPVAAEALGRIGVVAESALPLLIELHYCRPTVAMGSLAIPQILEKIQSARTVATALPWCRALSQIGTDGATELQRLQVHVRGPIREALDEIGRTVDGSIDNVASPGGIPARRTDLNQLERLLRSVQPTYRQEALVSLSMLGTSGNKLLEQVRAATNDPAPEVRITAARALWKLDPTSAEIIPTLIKILTCDHYSPRTHCDRLCIQAADALAQIGPVANSAIPDLLFVLRRTSCQLGARDRGDSVRAGYCDFDGSRLEDEPLANDYQRRNSLAHVCLAIAQAIASIEPFCEQAILILGEALDERRDDHWEWLWAARALTYFDVSAAAEAANRLTDALTFALRFVPSESYLPEFCGLIGFAHAIWMVTEHVDFALFLLVNQVSATIAPCVAWFYLTKLGVVHPELTAHIADCLYCPGYYGDRESRIAAAVLARLDRKWLCAIPQDFLDTNYERVEDELFPRHLNPVSDYAGLFTRSHGELSDNSLCLIDLWFDVQGAASRIQSSDLSEELKSLSLSYAEYLQPEQVARPIVIELVSGWTRTDGPIANRRDPAYEILRGLGVVPS